MIDRKWTNDFGFTNEEDQLWAAEQWRNSAVADGWLASPMYPNSEPSDRATRLKHPDGFVAQVLTRNNVTSPPQHGPGKWKYEAGVHVWGPDGLAVIAGWVYDMNQLRNGLTSCHYCKASDVPTVRVGFAGRVCSDCRTEVAKVVERPGWDN